MDTIVITTEERLSSIIRNTLISFEKEKEAKMPPKIFTVNQVAKKLGKAPGTIKKYVDKGIIRSTKNGLIPEDAINEFLNR
jgi:hypothetical protein